ncbi:MAG: hypothetical protein Ct9H300mP7_4900 [Verrucomicrobiota bacterium]|nr:MAG: hypothetical protein Ct9H300mP7_4900 [Verrucomicrobiota bacterium]
MDGSYGEASLKVREFEAVLKNSITLPVKTWDERLTSVQANRALSQGGVKKQKKPQKRRCDGGGDPASKLPR